VETLDLNAWSKELRGQMLSAGFEPSLITEVKGFSIEGFVRYSKSNDAPLVYLSSGIHGDEPAGPLAIQNMLRESLFSKDLSWLICPMMNPTGHMKGVRENYQGIDLNRDYFHCISSEIQGHVAWLENLAIPDIMLSLHEDWETTGYYFYEINTRKEEGDGASKLMTALDQKMSRERSLIIDDHKVREPGWIYHEAIADEFEAWPEAIYLSDRGCTTSLTMETPSSLELEQRVDLQMEFIQRAVEIWL